MRAEGLQQLNRTLGKFTWLPAPDNERADDLVGAKKRHNQQSAKAGTDDDIDCARWIVLNIGDLYRCTPRGGLAHYPLAHTDMAFPKRGGSRLFQSVGCPQAEFLVGTVDLIDSTGLGARELGCLRHDGGQNGFEIDRGIHSLGHFAERAQLPDRLREFSGSGLKLMEQAGVFNRNDGLRCKIRHQFDLLFGEGAHFLPVDGKNTNQLVLLEHWYVQQRAETTEFNGGHKNRRALDICRLRLDVDNMNCLLRLSDTTKGSMWARSLRASLPKLRKFRRHTDTSSPPAQRHPRNETGLQSSLRRCEPHWPTSPRRPASVRQANLK